MDATQQQFVDLLVKQDVQVDERQLEQFELYFQELISWNERMNLTGITERDQVYIKHFYDSLTLAFHVDMTEVGRMIDVGSGAGFPGIPLKILFPHLKLTIVDSLNKRISFLQNLVNTLDLKGVTLVHSRAEDLARKVDHRDQYDLATARAVARLSVLNEFCLPFVKTGGHFVAMKGNDPTEELKEASYSLKELRGKVTNNYRLELPNDQSERHLIIIRKRSFTPNKYPRKAGTPLKTPLI
ncbi:16S rRNA (guanine527-N7)-methyltransferase [Paenibacillus shirakamiensis]|uniref:Ribosomal RNA small subunit methyltransferase G n=1 Tax=Paenibacillus shirakamiensis TaxID=1265935 RepID=A0ABS4JKY9_9BACL|nr:16S rRNA (guanine(527)-N(7))-methyltransferase RsmG [Paenibacillus shirakamiensis]MBP2002353.1 16S rRNA (guanine527-N7)-methyltransferase [Paenibacillus shirakamiensis]